MPRVAVWQRHRPSASSAGYPTRAVIARTPRRKSRDMTDDQPSTSVVLERRWLPGQGGSLIRLSCTNVPMPAGSPAADWGNHTPGAYALALAIVEAALVRMGHSGPLTILGGQRVYLASALIHPAYVRSVLSRIEDDATIPTRVVDEWVTAATRELGSALVVPRFSLAGEEGGPWTAAEVGEIIGVPVYEDGDALIRADGRRLASRTLPHPLDTDEGGWIQL